MKHAEQIDYERLKAGIWIKGLYFHQTFEIKWRFQIFEPENLKDVLHKLVDTLGLKKSVDKQVFSEGETYREKF